MKTLVKDVMTTRVVWVRRIASFKEMAAALRENRVSAFPVLDDDDKVIGVVSEADLLTKEALNGEPGVLDGILHRRDQQKARGITAGDLMTHPAVTVAPDDTIAHAAQLMYSRKVKRLPVTDPEGRLAGIISRADVLTMNATVKDVVTAPVVAVGGGQPVPTRGSVGRRLRREAGRAT